MATTLVLATPLAAGSSAASASPPGMGSADAVVTWNAHAVTAVWDVAHHQPWEQFRDFAMMHGAMYDAVNAIAGTPYEPYLIAPEANGSESTDAAVGAAAYHVLVSIFPDQQPSLQAKYDQFLAAISAGTSKQRGVEVGTQAAAAMIAARLNDGFLGSQSWIIGTQPGQWRPTPPFFGSAGAWVGHLRPFLVPDASMFLPDGPPALTSNQYALDFNEVKEIGSVSSRTRTADQTDSARWWHDRRMTEWEIKSQLIGTQHLNVLQATRMLAVGTLSAADATITCGVAKAKWSFWRPVTAIQLAGDDGNRKTVADPNWQPLLITPPFPDYTSGHACSTTALMSALAVFFGTDRVAFHATSEATGTTRYFDRFSEAIVEINNARVWGGIHFRSADIDGVQIGLRTTAYVVTHHFRPTT